MALNTGAAGANTNIEIRFGDTRMGATVFDNPTAAEFLKMLPITIQMSDIPGQEYAGRLPQPVSTGGPAKTSHTTGDIAYWSPGNSLVFFYETNPDFGYTIHPIGKFDSDTSVFKELGGRPIKVTINKTNK